MFVFALALAVPDETAAGSRDSAAAVLASVAAVLAAAAVVQASRQVRAPISCRRRTRAPKELPQPGSIK